jgi:hypothetical protein
VATGATRTCFHQSCSLLRTGIVNRSVFVMPRIEIASGLAPDIMQRMVVVGPARQSPTAALRSAASIPRGLGITDL